MRDCLTEASDLDGCRELLAGIESGSIEVYGRDTVQPSVFSHQILNAMPYAFLDDAPLEERRARAVPLRRALPEDSRDLTRLDPEAIRQESENAWPRIRDVDELHDALLTLGCCPRGRPAHFGRKWPDLRFFRGWSSWPMQEGHTGSPPTAVCPPGSRQSGWNWLRGHTMASQPAPPSISPHREESKGGNIAAYVRWATIRGQPRGRDTGAGPRLGGLHRAVHRRRAGINAGPGRQTTCCTPWANWKTRAWCYGAATGRVALRQAQDKRKLSFATAASWPVFTAPP